MGRTLPVPVMCQVCGDKSYGRHYGVYCCDGCSCFFKRSIRKGIVYTCISGDGQCVVDKARRNWCPACRLRKCLAVKMNKNAVQEERGPRNKSKSNRRSGASQKIGSTSSVDSTASKQESKPKSKKQAVCIPTDNVGRTAPNSDSGGPRNAVTNKENFKAMLRLCIQACVETPVLKFASAEHKKLVLKRAWPQLFLLYASTCRTPGVNVVVEEFLTMVGPHNRIEEGSTAGNATSVKVAIGQLLKFGQALYMDSQEYHLSMCMIICFAGGDDFSNGSSTSASSSGQTGGLQELYRLMLFHHAAAFYGGDPLRATKLIYFLAALKSAPVVNEAAVAELFFGGPLKEVNSDIAKIIGQASKNEK